MSSRTNAKWLAALCTGLFLTTAELDAQVYYALGVNKTTNARSVWRRDQGQPIGVQTQIVFNNPASFPNEGCFEVDARTGHLITVSSSSTAGIRVYRNQVLVSPSGVATAFATLLVTIPNTSSSTPVAMCREASGAFLLLHSKSIGSLQQDNSIHRIGLGTAGAVAIEVPCDDQFATGLQWGLALNDIASDGDGNIVMNSNFFAGASGGNLNRVYTLPPIGGMPGLYTGINIPSNGLLTMCIETEPGGAVYVGGVHGTADTIYTNFGGTQVSHRNMDLIRDVVREPAGTVLWIEEMPTGSGVWQTNADTTWPTTTPTALWVMPTSDWFPKLAVDYQTYPGLYGHPCTTAGLGAMPQISQSGPPMINFLWQVNLENGFSNQTATLYLGAEIPPLLLSGSCAAYNSALFSFPVQTNGSGDASYTFSIPNDVSLIGVPLYTQWLVPDTAGGFAMSGALASTVQ